MGALASVEEFDTLTSPLSPGTYELGTLAVDFAGSELLAGMPGVVTLLAADSVIGVESPEFPFMFRFVTAREQAVIPEPSSFIILAPIALALVGVSLYKKSQTASGKSLLTQTNQQRT